MVVLTINAGSSSIRLAIFAEDGRERLAEAHYTGRDAGADPKALLRTFLRQYRAHSIGVAAHRVVHGGARLTQPCVIDEEVKAEIERMAPLAPLHNPVALHWIQACETVLGIGVPQVAAFDTAFYTELPQFAASYALPRALCEKHGVRRYGFHGLAHEAMWRRWRTLRPDLRDGGRIISLQLGAGCSITAVKHGHPVDTSMGFTPLEGLVMATRSGDVDPGLHAFLQRAEGLAPDQVEHVLTHDSGLRGMAGEGDMQALLARDDADARLAVDVYCYRARKYVGAYFAALGGADAIVFGGGVGEHAAPVRSQILAELNALGIALDEAANRAAVGAETRINQAHSSVDVWVIPVDEAAVLARYALAVIRTNAVGRGIGA